jgi:site-specific DNA recombinase
MVAVATAGGEDLLRGWAGGRAVAGGARRSITVSTVDGGLRFAFYGRMSTDDFQDRATSRRWQRDGAVAAIADPVRGFDAIVVGEYERAFAGRQLLDLLPIQEQYGVQLWLPETHGRVDRHDPGHEALILLLGADSSEPHAWRMLVPGLARSRVGVGHCW